jgi:hypothetical protein
MMSPDSLFHRANLRPIRQCGNDACGRSKECGVAQLISPPGVV